MVKLIATYSDRIDKYITNNSSITRNDIQELIAQGAVFVNGKKINKNKYIVNENDEIEIIKVIEKQTNVVAQNIDIEIIYENEDYLIVNKPSGMTVHPAPGHYDNTLVNALMYHFKNNLSNVNGLLRLGIIHRIDKDTSGLLIVAKNNATHNYFASLLKEHKIDRTYVAIVDGKIVNKKMHIDLPIGRDQKNRQKFSVTQQNSKNAYTMIEVIKHFKIGNDIKTLVKCNLKTGRTHQIRVHLNYIKHPVYGDPIYNKKIDGFNQRLHAMQLDFVDNKGEIKHFEAPIPEIMLKEIAES
ncbi:RluA family pseudouridine synthase [Mycoplasma enhydrae]|uniref:RluA family pseudouridine synthase n=1 Tax=Mycoplasma enhydrae TaxID=2499220 RepID=UPI00197B0EBF|nr:RluA family pseudouridine synthase [Mycoplasma enhydrae]MBN4089543.1 RluA family pseudouridine synthase [Mycoplasma enhydrae]MCV3733520.1 RluA family pseudouridine synthase [Mycoplasma enhydrae]MCV3753232.1 RluA family pseudouridine synthase [Mycoplasma enhydrae]